MVIIDDDNNIQEIKEVDSELIPVCKDVIPHNNVMIWMINIYCSIYH